MNHQALLRAVVESAAFYELSSDHVIDPDVAVAQLEQLSAILQELGSSERQELIRCAREMAAAEALRSGQTPRVEFLSSIGDALGWS